MAEVGGDRPSSRRGQPVLPEKRLFTRYRHVYAGKGGWLATRTSMAPPVNYNSTNHYLDVYKKELILRLSKDIFESNRQNLSNTTASSNKASGDLDHSLTTEFNMKHKQPVSRPLTQPAIQATSPQESRPATQPATNTHTPPDTYPETKEGSGDIEINVSIQKAESPINNTNQVFEKVPDERGEGFGNSQEDPVNNTANEKDNCFITSLKRAHTIIGTIHPADNYGNGNQIIEAEQSKQAPVVDRETQINASAGSLSSANGNVLTQHTHQTGDTPGQCHTAQNTVVDTGAKESVAERIHVPSELELRVLRERSFVKRSRMAGGGDGRLSRSGRHLVTRMSQEALLAISETRKEMAQVSADTPPSPPPPHKEDIVPKTFRIKDTESVSISGELTHKLLSPASKKQSTEATPISPDLKLMSVMTKQRKKDTIRYSFNMSRLNGVNPGSRRFSKSGSGLRIHENNSVLNSPKSKLPYLNSRSTEELHKTSTPMYRGNKDKSAPLTFHTLNNFKMLSKEKSFQITPPGWDVRYKDLGGRKTLETVDDTPDDVKEKAIEKCSDWLTRYT